ncbi:hypothetical protein PNH50_13290 [Leisingera aquaemixtae]|uniref:Uncharacterized protein n=1 Tax=Leisingera aquaemixtae TaxID=1396826 RepID=A0A0P1HAL3_9RHOB|nr:hypothetical protein [Leisingera aquaemixtae]UWQ23905.1 hypothetical protein K3553_13090 [Leisingera aquaemixtae]UWQ36423.1 hypothetical protein K3552_13015 [Leisingera aquaemixtae]UWQ40533.1 hypothetical protein K3718_13340 [Leisingera aquaemixtae]UWQ44787.1 hypothetical protein K3719_13425 [Leisingera aquaemixtae]CUI00540.1 hypothetical protein PHA8399_02672 [Leisingera aquaemixtae]
MGEHHDQFQARLKQINRKHEAMAGGYSAKLRPDGLLVIKPGSVQSRISARTLVFFAAAFLLFKGFLMAALGFGSYDQRVRTLAGGSAVERAGAFIMQADPVSVFFAQKIGPVLR